MNKEKRTRAGTIALYVLAVLLLCYGAYMAFSAYDYVSQYYEYQGVSLSENLGETAQYVISQSYPYLCFSIVFYVMGLLLQKLNDLHDFLPREYLHPSEPQEQEIPLDADVTPYKAWEETSETMMPTMSETTKPPTCESDASDEEGNA